MQYMTVNEAASKWQLTTRRVRILCSTRQIDGVKKDGRSYLIPINAVRPIDKRIYRGLTLSELYAPLFYVTDALKAELDSRRPLTQGELSRIREEFLANFTYNSNAIEGSTLTLSETVLALEGLTVDQKPLREHLEVVGHRDAFLFIEELVQQKTVISESIIKQIHSLVLMDRPNDKGVYRSIGVRITDAFHSPPEPFLVPIKMGELLSKTKEKLHIIERTAIFHLKFESIHPFIDGNGRTGRLLINLMLMQAGYPPINVKFTDRQRYFACFGSYHTTGDTAPMVILLTEHLKEQLDFHLSVIK